MRVLRCPACATNLSLRDSKLLLPVFSCPACDRELEVPAWYSLIVRLLAFGLSAWVSHILGFSGGAFVSVALFLGIGPLGVALRLGAGRILPPRLRVRVRDDGLLHLNSPGGSDRQDRPGG